MQLLLDSHSLLWTVFDHKKLSVEAQAAIAAKDNIVYVSIASLWEISIKNNIGRLPIPEDFFDNLKSGGFEILQVAIPHINVYNNFPLHHRDPFDRMLIAQAMNEQFTLVTRDPEIIKYDVVTLSA